MNPKLNLDNDIIVDGLCRYCGDRYDDYRISSLPKLPGKRLSWAKRQIASFDGDSEWYWSLRVLLYVLKYVKTQEFIAKHQACKEIASVSQD